MRKLLSSILLLVVVVALNARTYHVIDFHDEIYSKDRPPSTNFSMTVGEVWNVFTNAGGFGGERGQNFYGYTWPGGAVVNNYYLWNSYFWVGAIVNGQAYVTAYDYPSGEWAPSDGPAAIFVGAGKSVYDVVVAFDDYKSNPNNSASRHLGVKVIVRAMQWPHHPYNKILPYEIFIIYDSDSCDIPGHTDVLDSVMVGIVFDADVSGADESEPHIDDLVMFDGWVNNEWDGNTFFTSPTDSFTLLSDTFYVEPDGIPDQYVIWGDDPGEHVIMEDADTIIIQRGESVDTIYGYIFPRGMSYIYDGDNPHTPEKDVGENGKCTGYIGGAWLYTPEAPGDSTITLSNGHVLRFVRPWSHNWWNWETDPATDEERYDYMMGRHSGTRFHRFAPHPWDLGAQEFDYRFLSSVGPFQLRSGDTLKLVFVGAVGYGLNGGADQYWFGGEWQLGVRQLIDLAYKAYYTGDTLGDPAHPTPPIIGEPLGERDEVHWQIPIPPVSPTLVYSATDKGVSLLWDSKPEYTPDPRKGYVDFRGYRIYRAKYVPSNWELIAELAMDTVTHEVPHSYVDSVGILPGYPYYYVVVAYDEDGLESPKNNYKRDATGAPVAVVIPTASEKDLEKVYVVPNPYLGAAPWTATEIADKIEFHNLPRSCRIKIFTLSGDLVKEIVHVGTGSAAWNLMTDEGIKVSSGVYIYKVETPDGKYKIGKFVILK